MHVNHLEYAISCIPECEHKEDTAQKLRQAYPNPTAFSLFSTDGVDCVSIQSIKAKLDTPYDAIALVGIRRAQVDRVFNPAFGKSPLQLNNEVFNVSLSPQQTFVEVVRSTVTKLHNEGEPEDVLTKYLRAAGDVEKHFATAMPQHQDSEEIREDKMIRMYTMSIRDLPTTKQWYCRMNDALMQRVQHLAIWVDCLFLVDKGIHRHHHQRIKGDVGLSSSSSLLTVYRGANVDHLDKFVQGSIVTFSRVNSFSKNKQVASDFAGNLRITAHVHTWMSAASLSQFRDEDEVLLPCCSMFCVSSCSHTSAGVLELVVRQVVAVPLFRAVTPKFFKHSLLPFADRLLKELHCNGASFLPASASGSPTSANTPLSHFFDEEPALFVVGTIKAGKSTFVNAILGCNIAPTNEIRCTAVIVRYRHVNGCRVPKVDPQDHVKAENQSDASCSAVDNSVPEISGRENVTSFLAALNDDVRRANEENASSSNAAFVTVRVEFPEELKQTGIRVVVDCPGLDEYFGAQAPFLPLLKQGIRTAAAVVHVVSSTALQRDVSNSVDPSFKPLQQVAEVVMGVGGVSPFVVGTMKQNSWSSASKRQACREQYERLALTLYPGMQRRGFVEVVCDTPFAAPIDAFDEDDSDHRSRIAFEELKVRLKIAGQQQEGGGEVVPGSATVRRLTGVSDAIRMIGLQFPKFVRHFLEQARNALDEKLIDYLNELLLDKAQLLLAYRTAAERIQKIIDERRAMRQEISIASKTLTTIVWAVMHIHPGVHVMNALLANTMCGHVAVDAVYKELGIDRSSFQYSWGADHYLDNSLRLEGGSCNQTSHRASKMELEFVKSKIQELQHTFEMQQLLGVVQDLQLYRNICSEPMLSLLTDQSETHPSAS